MRAGFKIFAFAFLVSFPASAEEFPSDKTHATSLSQLEALENTSLGVSGVQPRALMPLALDLIKDFEAWKPNAYNDASDYCTIGYGHLIAKKPCSESAAELAQFSRPLTLNAGLELLTKDTTVARLNVQALVHSDIELSDEKFGALTSFVFNVGGGNFSKSRILRYVNNSEFDPVPKELLKWVKSNGVTLDGLITRRTCEADLFRGKLGYGEDKKFHRDDCESLGAAPDTDSLIDMTSKGSH